MKIYLFRKVIGNYQNADDNITNKTLCAGSTSFGTTYGDSGTPLHTVDDKGSWYLTGIMSFVLANAKNDSIINPQSKRKNYLRSKIIF
jgi:secreted trypsin-like serine protease